jgi:hypothetical protein
MDRFDGRSMAVGIVLGMVVGLALFALTSNTMLIYLSAGIGAVLCMNAGFFKDKDDPGDS